MKYGIRRGLSKSFVIAEKVEEKNGQSLCIRFT